MVTTVTDNSPQSINTSLFSLDREVQEVKKTADALNDKLSGIDTESGVISVNGKQGIVELNASDVDALPSSTVIPTTTSELTNNSGFITINDVGSSLVPVTRKVNNKSLDSDITLTASDVKALPDTTVIPTKTSQLTNDSGFITSSDSITGNAATATTADKVKNALTVNGKTYDGSTAIDAGVQTIANGGTGQTTQVDINKAIVGELPEGNEVVTDGTMFVSSYASDNGFADTNAVNVPYKRKFSRVWEYIKGKISSVLGITSNKHIIKGQTVDTNTYTDTNPKLVFSNVDGSQDASLTFTDYDSVQFPASLTLNGNQGGEYFIAPNIKATDKFYGNLSGKADTAGTADKATQDGSGNVITDTYLPLSGGAMTGDIKYKGSKSTDSMIKFIDNKDDAWGNGISIGGGGLTIIGGGESSDTVAAQQTSGGDEKMIIANDEAIDFYTNCQDGFASAKHITMNKDGTITAAGFNGKANTAGTADSANALVHRGYVQSPDTFQSKMNNDGKWVIETPGWTGSLYTLYANGSMSGLMFRINGGSTGPNQVQINYSIDSNRFGMNWATIINSENIKNYIEPLKSRISALESKIQ